MIPVDDLEHGEWYDGFLIRAGKQAGTATLQWLWISNGHGEFFDHGEDTQGVPHYDEADGWGGAKFEPNMRSVAP